MADKKISALTGATTPLAGTEVLPIVQSSATVKVSVTNLTAGRTVDMAILNVDGTIGKIGNINTTTANGGYWVWQTNGTSIWDIGTAKQVFNTGTANDGGLASRTGYYFGLGANGAESLRLTTTGDVSVLTGNLVIGTSGKGVDFSATSHLAGMTSELLADYEEGTWTTTVSSLSNWNATPTLSAAIYTKVGRMVTIEGKITGTTTIVGATALFFTIPFSTADVSSGATGSAFEQGGYVPGNVSDPTSGSSNVMLLTTGVLAGGVSRIVNFSITYCAA